MTFSQATIYSVGFITGIFLTLFALFWSSNKILAIWLLFGCIIGGALTAFMYWHNDIYQHEIANKEREEKSAAHSLPPPVKPYIIPSNEPNPPNPCLTRDWKKINFPPETCFVYLGKSLAYTTKDSFDVVMVDDKPILSIRRNEYGLFISFRLFDVRGIILVEIIDNKIIKNTNNFCTLERPDEHTLKVLDSNNTEKLFVKYLNPSSIFILGDIYKDSKKKFIVKEDYVDLNNNYFYSGCFKNSINLSAGAVSF